MLNKGGNDIDDMYIGLWSDPDLGDAGDDFVGCDTTLGLGFCWNDGVDSYYSSYSGGTPAVGYDFFRSGGRWFANRHFCNGKKNSR